MPSFPEDTSTHEEGFSPKAPILRNFINYPIGNRDGLRNGNGNFTSMRRLRVLIVEDDHALRSMICDNLKRLMGEERLEILCASDFHEGSALLAEEHFDIVIADFHLPGGDGAKIALRAFPTPAIIITADASDYPPIAAARVSTAGFLRKPFRAIHLLGAIAAALWQRDRKRITKWLFRNGP